MVAGPTLSCSVASLQVGEPQVGTALAGVRAWLVLEHYGPWAPDAIESPQLSEAVRAHVRAFLEAVPGSRFQLVRQVTGDPGSPPHLFLVDADREDPRVLEWHPSGADALCQIDLVAALDAGTHPGATLRREPLHLVCTHGKRDRCCALAGIPLSRAMAELAPDEVFQSSHVGGHRFAPNVLSFPEGVCYGRLSLDDAAGLVEAHRRGELHRLEALRGRMRFSPPVQAAEVFLRTRLRALGGGAPRLLAVEPDASGGSRVRLELAGQEHEVAVRPLPPGPPRPASCGDAPSPSGGFGPG